jgi:hypothetical protein
MDALLVVIPITNGASVGIQSNTYKKNGGENAFDVEKLEVTENDSDGYIDTDLLMQDNDIVALPLTSFKPESRNITSKESINVNVCGIKEFGNSTSTYDSNFPGITLTLIVNTLRNVSANKLFATVPMSKKTSLVPARQRNSGPALIWLLFGFSVTINSNGRSLSHETACNKRRMLPRGDADTEAAVRPNIAPFLGTTRTRTATPAAPDTGFPPAS